MTPTLQASDLDVEGLVRDLPALREEAESFAKAAHAGVTDLAALVSLLLAEVDTATAQLAAAEANLAAANKQIEAMDLALEFYASEARAAKKHMATNNAAPLEAILTVLALDGGGRADNARTALSHEAHNG